MKKQEIVRLKKKLNLIMGTGGGDTKNWPNGRWSQNELRTSKFTTEYLGVKAGYPVPGGRNLVLQVVEVSKLRQ
jgi:hypothetical protein